MMTRSGENAERTPLILWSLGLVVVSLNPAAMAAFNPDEIDAFVHAQMKKEHFLSLSVGVLHDQELIFAKAYGLADRESGRAATPDTIYRIGSVTKVFTTTLMCILRDQGRLQLDDPVAKYLPAEVRFPADPRGAPAITLRHLATHTSGLPRMPVNFQYDGRGISRGYSPLQLYEALGSTQLQNPTGARCVYSNLGMGLLGHALSRVAGESYDAALRRYLLDPLEMTWTACKLSAEQRALLAVGYRGHDLTEQAPEEDMGCLAGCGDLASNVPDLAKFLSLQMRAGQPNVGPVSGGTLTELHTPQRLMDSKWEMAVGLGWMILPPAKGLEESGEVVWHNGGTAGYCSWVGFAPSSRVGAIVLTNCSKATDGVGLAVVALAAEQFKATTVATGPLPAADVILDAYVEATGGADAHRQLQSLAAEGTLNAMGMELKIETWNAALGRSYTRIRMAEVTLSEQGTDGQISWEKEMLSKPEIHTVDERAYYLREADLQQHVDWRKHFTKVRTVRQTRFNDHDCYELELMPHEGLPETRYYGMQSKLLAGSRIQMKLEPFGQVPVETVFDDYRTIGGVLHPCSGRQLIAESEDLRSHFQLTNIEANVEIPAARFELPSALKKLATQPVSQPAPADSGR